MNSLAYLCTKWFEHDTCTAILSNGAVGIILDFSDSLIVMGVMFVIVWVFAKVMEKIIG